jgi:putative transposase
MNSPVFKRAPHNPPHLFLPDAIYMLTASIYEKEPLIASSQRKMEWGDAFVNAAELYGWQIIAWVVLSDHYHAMVQAPKKAETLSKFIGSYHKYTARKWNNEDNTNGRKVWWNYWDTCIRSEKEYHNRLRYIFWNPVKHGLTSNPEEYKFSNYTDYLLQWQVEFNFTDMDEVNDVPEF